MTKNVNELAINLHKNKTYNIKGGEATFTFYIHHKSDNQNKWKHHHQLKKCAIF